MQVSYEVNLVIFDLIFCPKTVFDLHYIKRNVTRGAFLYRGSLTCKRNTYTLKLTRNGFCSIYLRRNFSRVLSDLTKLTFEVCTFLEDPSGKDLISVCISPKNIQITFHIILEKYPKFRFYCIAIIQSFSSDYDFEIKESNSSDSLWLPYVVSDLYFSSFRIKSQGTIKCIFTFSYTFKGSCLTGDIAEFQKLCYKLRLCYLENCEIW